MARKKPSTKKDKSTPKKKASLKKGSSEQEKQANDVSLAVVAFDAVVGEFQAPPASSGQCILWRDGDVHRRIRAALSVWSQQPPNNITSNTTLGQLAVGTGIPWNEGNQGRLVQATNEQNVFFPFNSRMNPPPVLVPSATTVAEWERVVWAMQTPETFCFVFGS
jgi:hypothetical protein